MLRKGRKTIRRRYVAAMLGVAVSAAAALFPASARGQAAARPGGAGVAATSAATAPATAPAAPIDPAAFTAERLKATITAQLVADGDLSGLSVRLAAAAKPNPALLGASATVALEAGDLPTARAALEGLVLREPESGAVWARLAMVRELVADDPAAIAALRQAIAKTADAAALRELRIRLALILFDSDKRDDAAAVLQEIAAGGTREARVSAAFIAEANGDPANAARLLGAPREGDGLYEYLLQGTCLLDAGQGVEARQAFEKALTVATRARDRRYVYERITASARQSGDLGALADAWLKDLSGPADRLYPLLGLLRELGRPADALKLVAAAPATPAMQDALRAPGFQREALSIAMEAGQAEEARQTYRTLMAREPGNDQWLIGLVRLELSRENVTEADALLTEAIAHANTASRLRRLADTAQGLGRSAAARRAAEALGQMGNGKEIESLVLMAKFARQDGDTQAAEVLLDRATTRAANDEAQLLVVAEALEQAGNRRKAIALLVEITKKSDNDAVVQHLAWLLEQEGRIAEAKDLWMRVWRTTTNLTRRRQAQDRVLELAARTGAIADLAISLENDLAAGKAGPDDLELLVEIYASMKDPASVAEILQTFRSQAGGQVGVMQQLVKVYLQCERFGQANQILQKLLVADPDNALDTLQEIAVVAVERKRPLDALAALEEMQRRTGMEQNSATLRAGVLDQLGLSAEAASEYRRGLARQPDQVEEWLLWAQAKAKAGGHDEAIARLQLLTEESTNDDLFTVALDGLLNLEASKSVLQTAYRRALTHIALNPDKVVLYKVAGDVAEAVPDAPDMLRVGELSLLVAGEQRTTLLRELSPLARRVGQSDRAVAYGNTLLALGEDVPPEVFLDIGGQLLAQARVVEAERALGRACELSTDETLREQVAALYEQAGYPEFALRTLRELVARQATDVGLQTRVAGLYEQTADYPAAFEHYKMAIDILLRREPELRQEAATGKSGSTTRIDRAAPATSVSELTQYLGPATTGWLGSARTPGQRQLLLKTVQEWANAQLERSKGNAQVTALAEMERLEQYSLLLRRAAFGLHQPDLADAFDRALLARFPNDKALAALLVQERIAWGLYDRALAFVSAGVTAPPQLLTPQQLAAAATTGSVRAEAAADLLPRLIMADRLEDARHLLRAVPHEAPAEPLAVIPTLLTASFVLDDADSAAAWTEIWLKSCEDRPGRKATSEEISTVVRTAWPALGPVGRKELLGRLVLLVPQMERLDRAPLARLSLRISRLLEVPLAERQQFVQWDAESAQGFDATNDALRAAQPADQVTVLQPFIASIAPPRLRPTLLTWMASVDTPLAPAAVELIVKSYGQAPGGRVAAGGDDRYTGLQSSWTQNKRQPEMLIALARLMQKEAPNDAGTAVTVALALRTAGKIDEAEALARKGALQTIGRSQLARVNIRIATDALALLRPQTLTSMLDEASHPAATLPAVNQLLLKALILQQLDRRPEARAALTGAFGLAPGNQEVRRMLGDALENDLRYADFVQQFMPYAQDESVMKIYDRMRLARTLLALNDMVEAEQFIGTSTGPIESVQRMQIAAARGMPDQLLRLHRNLLVTNRREQRFYTPFFFSPYTTGGLTEFLERESTRAKTRTSVHELVANQPAAFADFTALLDAAVPGAHDASGLLDGLAAAAVSQGRVAEVFKSLQEAHDHNAVTTKDRALLLALALRAETTVPQGLSSELNAAVRGTPPDDGTALGNLADTLSRVGQSRDAAAVLRWATGADVVVLSRGRDAEAIRRRRAALLALVPAEERSGTNARLVAAAAPGPGDILDDRSEALRLEDLATSTTPEAAEAALAAVLRRNQSSASAYPRLALLAAELAARRGDVPAFKERMAAAIESQQSRIIRQVVDLRPALPPDIAPDKAAPFVAVLGDLLIARHAAGDISAPDACHALCLLGWWCDEHGMAGEAAKFLDRAEQLSGDPGEQDLWIADLALRLKMPEVAERCEVTLLRQRALPLPRITRLLASVQAARGSDAADALAAEATYCTERDILTRAIRWAKGHGHPADAEAWAKRLAAIAAGPATQPTTVQ